MEESRKNRRAHLAAFELPARIAEHRDQLTHWADLLATGRANQFKEQELLADFLTDFFVGVLGYARPADGGDGYTFSREKLVEVDGKFADAVLGRFRTTTDESVENVAGTRRCAVADHDEFVDALEGKGPKDPLDRPFAGRRMSAVDQGYRYAINLPCDFILVTNCSNRWPSPTPSAVTFATWAPTITARRTRRPKARRAVAG